MVVTLLDLGVCQPLASGGMRNTTSMRRFLSENLPPGMHEKGNHSCRLHRA